MVRLFFFNLAILLLGSHAISHAQSDWCWQNPLPCGNNLNDVCSIDGGITWIAVGEAGTIIRSTDGGMNWSLQSIGTTLPLKSVCFVDANNGWVVGGDEDEKEVPSSIIMHTTNGGISWVRQTNETGIPLNGVSFKDANTGMAVGGYYNSNNDHNNDGIILSTKDGGGTWVTQFIDVGPSYYYFTAVSLLGSSSAIVVGVNGRIFRTTDGGANWSSQETPYGGLYEVCFVDTCRGVIVGGGNNVVILRTTDAGKSWTSPIVGYSGYFGELHGVCFTDSNNGIAVGENSTGTGLILKTTNGGLTWAQQASLTSEYVNYAAIWLSGLNNAMVVGERGTILKTTDAGNNWAKQVRGTTKNLCDVCFVDANSGWVVGDGTILHTGDGGQTWSCQLMDSSLYLNDVCFVNAQTGVAVGTDWNTRSGVVLRTTNDGDTWLPQPSGVTGELGGVWFFNPDTGMIVGSECDSNAYSGIILRTTNGGESWVRQIVGSTSVLNAIRFADLNNGIIIGQKAESDSGSILKTTDGGNSWTILSMHPGTSLNDVSFSDAHKGTIVGGGPCMGPGMMLRTTDGGQSWMTQYLLIGLGSLHGIQFRSYGGSTIGIAVGSDEQGNGLILTSTDRGNSWERQSRVTGQYQWLGGGCFADSRNGWAVGSFGTILHTTNGGATFVEKELVHNVPTGYCLFQNYPNPFNPTTVISGQLTADSWVRIEVYDLLGRKVAMLADEKLHAGRFSYVFDGRHFSSGAYFCRMTAGSFTKAIAMILTK